MEQIRPAQAQDASRLAEILIFAKRTAYRHIFRNDAVSFGEMQVLPLALCFRDEPSRRENVLVYGADFARGLVRYSAAAGPAESTPSLEICELYVDPFFQGQGIGAALLAAAKEKGRAQGAARCRLWCLAKNRAGRAFYEAQGLQLTGRQKPQPGTPELLVEYAGGI